MTRLFVAVWPDADATATLRDISRPDEPGVRWLPAANWHVTLRFLGEVEDAEALDRLARAAPFPVVDAELGPTVEWLGPRLVVPVRGIDALATAVSAATVGLGEPPRHGFRGHLTIARAKRGARSSILGHPVTGRFAVTEVVLVRSELLPDGARYAAVATFPTA